MVPRALLVIKAFSAGIPWGCLMGYNQSITGLLLSEPLRCWLLQAPKCHRVISKSYPKGKPREASEKG